MSVSQQEIIALEQDVNLSAAGTGLRFKLSGHVAIDRLNDTRNSPMIAAAEVKKILEGFADTHSSAVKGLPHESEFIIRCCATDIHIPCCIRIEATPILGGTAPITHTTTLITIMRKKGFRSKNQADATYDV